MAAVACGAGGAGFFFWKRRGGWDEGSKRGAGAGVRTHPRVVGPGASHSDIIIRNQKTKIETEVITKPKNQFSV